MVGRAVRRGGCRRVGPETQAGWLGSSGGRHRRLLGPRRRDVSWSGRGAQTGLPSGREDPGAPTGTQLSRETVEGVTYICDFRVNSARDAKTRGIRWILITDE